MRGRTGVLAGVASVLLAGLALAGCSGPAEPWGDAANPLPTESWNPGIGSSDGEPVGSGDDNRVQKVYLSPNTAGLPQGATLTLQRKDANCVRNEFDGTIDMRWNPSVLLMTTFGDSSACGVERSWATWTATYREPGGVERSATLEVAQISSPRDETMTLELKCWDDGALGCTKSTQYVFDYQTPTFSPSFFAR